MTEQKLKRYVVITSRYLYAEDDEQAVTQALEIAKYEDSEQDNHCTVDRIVEQPFGTFGNREIVIREHV